MPIKLALLDRKRIAGRGTSSAPGHEAGEMSPFPSKARTGIDFYRSPLHGALGFMPEYTEHAKANPIEIACGVRQLTDEEIEREAAFLRETRDELADTIDERAVLTHRQELHEKFAHVQRMKQRLREIEAELSEKSSRHHA